MRIPRSPEAVREGELATQYCGRSVHVAALIGHLAPPGHIYYGPGVQEALAKEGVLAEMKAPELLMGHYNFRGVSGRTPVYSTLPTRLCGRYLQCTNAKCKIGLN